MKIYTTKAMQHRSFNKHGLKKTQQHITMALPYPCSAKEMPQHQTF